MARPNDIIKRSATLLVSAVLCISLPSCATKTGSETKDERVRVVATDFAMYDLARAVCGDTCDVRMLISPGSESHDFEATLEDIALIAKTDVFVYVGGEGEKWVDDVLEASGTSAELVCATELVETYTVDTASVFESDDTDHDHDHDDEHGHEIDEHVWTSIPNAITIMNAIGAAVLREDEDFERQNAEYIGELLEIDAELRRTVENGARHTIVFADRFPFRYFTEEYALDCYAAFSGCSSAVEPSLSTVNALIEKVRSEDIPYIFVIEFSDRHTAEAIARETGAEILELHSAHNVSRADFDSGVTYADLMRRNAENLRLALN